LDFGHHATLGELMEEGERRRHRDDRGRPPSPYLQQQRLMTPTQVYDWIEGTGHLLSPTTPSFDRRQHQQQPCRLAQLAVGQPVLGVACLGQRLFVVRQYAAQLEVYSTTTFEPCVSDPPGPTVAVPGLRNPNDLAAAASPETCLYVVDCRRPDSRIFRIQLRTRRPESDRVSSWVVAGVAVKVSVNPGRSPSGAAGAGTVLVVFHEVRKIREYLPPEGTLIREFQLGQDLSNPWHAVAMVTAANGGGSRPGDQLTMVVCHGDVDDQVHRVCVVRVPPSSISSTATAVMQLPTIRAVYGSRKGRGSEGLLNVPSHMTVSPVDPGTLYVSDVNNRRVVALRVLTDAKSIQRQVDELVMPAAEDKEITASGGGYSSRGSGGGRDMAGGICYPRQYYPLRVCVDKSTERLYVACSQRQSGRWSSGCVLVFRTF
jgi:hypothetical protein